MLQSQVDSFNRQYAAEQAAAANQNNGGNQGQTRPGNNNTNSGGNNVTPAPTPTPTPTPAPAPSTNNNSGQGTSNGDYGNGYVAGQCTWWAYERRRQMGIGTPSYWVTVASGTLPHRRMVFAWIIARRSVRQSPSCPVRLVPMASTVMWVWWKR